MKSSKLKMVGWGAVVAALALLWAGAAAAGSGYWRDSSGTVVHTGYGECWKTGFWTAEDAIEGCDAVARTPAVAKVAPPPLIVSLQAEALFDFDRAELRPDGRRLIDQEVVAKLHQYHRVDRVVVTGHADRIGSEAYNQRLSQRRADAVARYLISRGVPAEQVVTVGRGESEPVVSCDEIKGRQNGRNKALVSCLQPNRRVVVEVDASE